MQCIRDIFVWVNFRDYFQLQALRKFYTNYHLNLLEIQITNGIMLYYVIFGKIMKTILQNIQAKIQSSSTEALSKTLIWQEDQNLIVFSNGCFDILHQGHVAYLAKAAQLGHKLVIGLNTDASVRRLKGENRPINNQEARALLLAALSFVDMVIFFDEDTPYNLIKAIQPDVLVKGADYNPTEVVGYDIVKAKGGTVKTIELEEGFSTTNTIEAILQKESKRNG